MKSKCMHSYPPMDLKNLTNAFLSFLPVSAGLRWWRLQRPSLHLQSIPSLSMSAAFTSSSLTADFSTTVMSHRTVKQSSLRNPVFSRPFTVMNPGKPQLLLGLG